MKRQLVYRQANIFSALFGGVCLTRQSYCPSQVSSGKLLRAKLQLWFSKNKKLLLKGVWLLLFSWFCLVKHKLEDCFIIYYILLFCLLFFFKIEKHLVVLQVDIFCNFHCLMNRFRCRNAKNRNSTQDRLSIMLMPCDGNTENVKGNYMPWRTRELR